MISVFRRHLDSAELTYAALAAPDGRTVEHLQSCGRCRAEHEKLVTALHADREAAQLAAADAFPAAELERQRLSIRQRIGRLGAVARVLPFPGAAPTAAVGAMATDRRWVMAAAAAGLLLGLVVGRLPVLDERAAPASERPTGRVAVADAKPVDIGRDDPLLSGVEEVLTRESRPEFEALDELTPLVDEGR